MATIKPFKGTYYNTKRVKLENVITQPYDKIDAKLYKSYLERDPYNGVRLILKENGGAQAEGETNPYLPQGELLKEWIKQGVFKRDKEDAIYCYDQEFTIFGERKKRRSFIALGQLHPYEEGVVYPHEETLSKPKADRLNHLRATQTQFGLIFMLYEDSERLISDIMNRTVQSQKPLFNCTDFDYGVQHRLWQISNPEQIKEIRSRMQDKKLLIADGHHRYETALTYRNEMRKQHPDASEGQIYDYAMMAFVNLYDEGLTILPTHRLVRSVSDDIMMNMLDLLRKEFRIERCPLPQKHPAEFVRSRIVQQHNDHHVIGLYYGGGDFILLHYLEKNIPQVKLSVEHSEAWRGLDVAILHKIILQGIFGIQEEAVRNETYLMYCREIEDALESVTKGRAQVAFFLNPTKPENVRDVAFGRERMPQKSTDFYPKLMTGLILNVMEGA